MVMKPSLLWHEHQSWYLRSCEASVTWLTEQITHGFMKTLTDTVKPMTQQAACAHIGLKLPKQLIVGYLDKEFDEVEIALEDELATKFAQLSLLHCGGLLIRFQQMLAGFSARSVLMLSEDKKVVDKEIRLLKRGWELYKKARANTDGYEMLADMADRSQFNLLPVVQLVRIFEQSDWKMTPQIKDFLKNKHMRIISSQISEDAFQRQKRRKHAL